jgi:hypothetical protein
MMHWYQSCCDIVSVVLFSKWERSISLGCLRRVSASAWESGHTHPAKRQSYASLVRAAFRKYIPVIQADFERIAR